MTPGPTIRPIRDGSFRFDCHNRMPCFTRCCADLNLVLTPYDILRLKNRLRLSSGDFLDRYTEDQIDDATGLPLVRLKMGKDESRRCPFVRPEGCSVYEDRPGACRLYPLARAAARFRGEKGAREKYFMVEEDHCLGLKEEKEWTLKEWLTDQGLVQYNAMNDGFMEVSTARSPSAIRRLGDQQRQMYTMAFYDLDGFRSFLLKSSFFKRFQLEDELPAQLRTDDEQLLTFAGRWLKFALFGERTLAIKPAYVP
jgi:Fe-S-cluster containining protein